MDPRKQPDIAIVAAAKHLEEQWRGHAPHWKLSDDTGWEEERSVIANRFTGVRTLEQLELIREMFNRRRGDLLEEGDQRLAEYYRAAESDVTTTIDTVNSYRKDPSK